MKLVATVSTALVLLAVVCLFSSDVSADHDPYAAESHWVGNLFGNAEIWGLGYHIPWARSSHQITVSNEGIGVGRYLYEFKISVPQAGLESKHPTNPRLVNINNGEVVVIPGQLFLDLRKANNIAEGQLFTLSCYTRLTIRKGNNHEQWRVPLEHDYMK